MTSARIAAALLAVLVSAPAGPPVPDTHDHAEAAIVPVPHVGPLSETGQGFTIEHLGPISEPDAASHYVEPWLAVDPTDPHNLVAAAMNLGAGEMRSVVWVSGDGGRSWTRAARGEGAASDFPDGDPMVTFDAEGTAYFTTLADGFSVWRSHDGGATWGEPTRVPGGSYDRQWLAVDRSGGPFHGRLYAAGKIWIKVFGSITQDLMAIARSEDGGDSFGWPRLLLPDPGQEVLHTVTDLIVTEDGALVAPFLTFFWTGPNAGTGGGQLRGRFSVVRSEDGGRSFSDPFEVSPMRSFGHAEPDLSNKSLGGGRIALDRSTGGFGGRMYLTWIEAVGRALHILVAASSDGGRTWTPPVRVNDGGLESASSNPAIAVGPDGAVLVTWNDRRADATGGCFNVYGAVSVDGGASFSNNQPVGEGRACPTGRFANGGDTQGLVALPDGGFVAAWIRETDQGLQVWYSVLGLPSR